MGLHQSLPTRRPAAWDTGVWGGIRSGLATAKHGEAGWAHNTKEIDGLTDLTYMYQRWYAPESGTFLSRAPYPPMMEHEYGFAAGNPVSFVDPDGRQAFPFPGTPESSEWASRAFAESPNNPFRALSSPKEDKKPTSTFYIQTGGFGTIGPAASIGAGAYVDCDGIGSHSSWGFGGGGGLYGMLGLTAGYSPTNFSDSTFLNGPGKSTNYSANLGPLGVAITRDDETGGYGFELQYGVGAIVNIHSVQKVGTESNAHWSLF